MALITVSGYPCSGKTRRSEQIKAYLESKLADVHYDGPQLQITVLSDTVLNISRDAYDDSSSEKPARAALFTAMQRQMGQDTILIVDAPNYIKGFRYQMYCAARELKLRVCTVYVVATAELCREWNSSRADSDQAYKPQTLDNLIMRYEEPSSMVRWDSPLFTVLWTDQDVPGSQIWDAVTKGNVKLPNSGTQAVPKAPTDALHTLEQTTTLLVAAIMNEQSQGLGGGGGGGGELQRLKRQFVTVHKKAITLGTTEKGAVDWSMESIAEKFTTYVQENLKP